MDPSGGVEEVLFDLAPTGMVTAGAEVDITMPWGETWRCTVTAVTRRDGWPAAQLQHQGQAPITVDLARCRLV